MPVGETHAISIQRTHINFIFENDKQFEAIQLSNVKIKCCIHKTEWSVLLLLLKFCIRVEYVLHKTSWNVFAVCLIFRLYSKGKYRIEYWK